MTGFESKRDAAKDKLQEPVDIASIIACREMLDAQPVPAREPVAWADLQKKAQQIVESKFLWKRFIDGTPLANDIACWMADFARQYTPPPQPAQEPDAYQSGYHDGKKTTRARCIELVLSGTGEPVQTRTLEILQRDRKRIAKLIEEDGKP